jgi:hypothetical protein
MTHLYLHQELNGLPVAGTELSAALDAQVRLLHADDKLPWNVAGRQTCIRPGISAADAVRHAAQHPNLSIPDTLVSTNIANDTRRLATFADPGVSRDPIPTQLAYVLTDHGTLLRAQD